MRITPTILEKTPQKLKNALSKLSPYFNHFQIDIADGKLVPNKTVSLEEISQPVALPKNLFYDFHLMAVAYEQEVYKVSKLFEDTNIDTIFIHSIIHPDINKLEVKYPLLVFGLAVNPGENVDTISQEYGLNNIRAIQVMSVYPGFQGKPFLPETLQKIEQLRHLGYKGLIYLDGSVNEKTIPTIISRKFGPDVLCPGSYLTRTDNLEKNVSFLKKFSDITEKQV